jgi:hypothetical protein
MVPCAICCAVGQMQKMGTLIVSPIVRLYEFFVGDVGTDATGGVKAGMSGGRGGDVGGPWGLRCSLIIVQTLNNDERGDEGLR